MDFTLSQAGPISYFNGWSFALLRFHWTYFLCIVDSASIKVLRLRSRFLSRFICRKRNEYSLFSHKWNIFGMVAALLLVPAFKGTGKQLTVLFHSDHCLLSSIAEPLWWNQPACAPRRALPFAQALWPVICVFQLIYLKGTVLYSVSSTGSLDLRSKLSSVSSTCSLKCADMSISSRNVVYSKLVLRHGDIMLRTPQRAESRATVTPVTVRTVKGIRSGGGRNC